MRLNTTARYAVRLMADIGKNAAAGETVPLKDVAERQNLSKRYLSQLATLLKNAQLLKSVWGMNGGYTLARPAKEISILEIVEAVEGPLEIIDCVGNEECMRAEGCDCRDLWLDLNTSIRDKLSGYSLSDLSGNGKAGGKKKFRSA